MKTKHEELTAGERRYLEHVERARSRGLVLSDYCRSIGMNPFALYSMRRQLRRKGKLPPAPPLSAARAQRGTQMRRPSALVAVRVAQPTIPMVPAVSQGTGMICRLRHASGWVIECGSWPPAGGVAECLKGVGHAAG